jgi:hypothetical protein
MVGVVDRLAMVAPFETEVPRTLSDGSGVFDGSAAGIRE